MTQSGGQAGGNPALQQALTWCARTKAAAKEHFSNMLTTGRWASAFRDSGRAIAVGLSVMGHAPRADRVATTTTPSAA
jgi:hypothetical protein